MYSDDEQLEQFRSIWLTKETHRLLKLEKKRLKKEDKREITMAKILNNLIIKQYETKTHNRMDSPIHPNKF